LHFLFIRTDTEVLLSSCQTTRCHYPDGHSMNLIRQFQIFHSVDVNRNLK
jgi:hypothetical protein